MHAIAVMFLHHTITLIQSLTKNYVAPFLDFLKIGLSTINSRPQSSNQTTQTTTRASTAHLLPTEETTQDTGRAHCLPPLHTVRGQCIPTQITESSLLTYQKEWDKPVVTQSTDWKYRHQKRTYSWKPNKSRSNV